MSVLFLQVKGFLERNGQKLDVPRLVGKWDDGMCAELADGTQQQLWKPVPLPANPTRFCCAHVYLQLGKSI